jgi:ATP-dependent Lon protease
MSQQLDPIDTIATKAFEGYVVRKDLVRKFKGQYPIPTYVAEFLLGSGPIKSGINCQGPSLSE